MRPWVPFLAVLFAVAMHFLPGRREKAPSGGALRVGLVFDVGGRGDKSFNDSAYLGLLRAEKELSADIAVLEPAGSDDREAGLRLFASMGKEIVFGVGFIFSTDIARVAAEYPKVQFAGIDYAPGPTGTKPNVLGLAFREEEGSFLVGAVSGLETKTKKVGFVGGMQGPLIRKFERGFEAGVHAVCPSCEVFSAYVGATPDAFRDPVKGKAVATSQIARGADVLYHASGATGHGVFEAARLHGVWAIGVDSDQYDEMPGVILTSMVKRVDVAVVDAIRRVKAGEKLSGMVHLGVREGAIDFVHEGEHARQLSPEVIVRVEALKRDIANGEITVPAE